MPLEVVAKQLGHANTITVSNTYGHLVHTYPDTDGHVVQPYPDTYRHVVFTDSDRYMVHEDPDPDRDMVYAYANRNAESIPDRHLLQYIYSVTDLYTLSH